MKQEKKEKGSKRKGTNLRELKKKREKK